MSAEGTGRQPDSTAQRESEEKFQAIFAQAAIGIAQIGLDGEWLLVNDRLCQMLGYSQDELRTKTLQDISPPEDFYDDFYKALAGRRKLLAGEISSHTMEKRYIRKDGSIFWGTLNRSLVRDHDNRPKYFVSVVEDITDKIQAESALWDSEQRIRATFFQAAVGIAQTDLDGKWLLVNNRFCEMLGYSKSELLHKTLEDITHPDDRSESLAGHRKLLAGEISSHTMEKRYLRKDGTVWWAKLNRSMARDRDDQPKYIIAVVEDITEKMQAERALRASEQRLVIAQEAAHIGLWDWDLRTNAHTVFGEYLALYGLPADHPQPTYEEWIALIHPEDRERVLDLLRDTLERTYVWDAEFRVVWPDGSVRWLLGKGKVFLDDSDQPVRLTGVNFDITERKETEAALRDSELLYKEVFDNISVCMFLVDVTSEGRFKFAGFNPAEEKAVGLTSAEVSGKFVEEVFDEPLANKLTANYRRCLVARTSIAYDDELNLPSGPRHFHSNLIPMRNASGGIHRIVGACIDTTDFKRTQEEALARQKLESLGVLAAGIAHDFNNLLGGILATAELVEADLAAGLSPREEIARIKTVAIRGAEIVRELMIYSGQAQSGQIELLDLSPLVEEMLELLRVSISKQAALKTDLGKNLPAVWGNAPQIRQVVMNLVINASEAIGEKEGVIQVTASRVTGGLVNLPTGDCVRLEVSDTGCGLTEEAKAKVFDPFFTTKFLGRGLGLAVVQGIVLSHGGAIHLVSAPGQGATFQVLLPCTSERALDVPNAIHSSDAEHSNARAGTILVAEDEEPLRLAISKGLGKKGFSVIQATDGSSAIELLRTHIDDIDVILLDVTLPGRSSREILEEAQRLRPNLKVILSSAYGKETVDASFTGLRVQHFIRKPFLLDDLVTLLQGALAC